MANRRYRKKAKRYNRITLRSASVLQSDTTLVKLKTSWPYTLSSGRTNTISVGGNELGTTGSNDFPRGLNAYLVFYNRYVVLQCDIKVTAKNAATGSESSLYPYNITCMPRRLDSTVHNGSTCMTQPYCVSGCLGNVYNNGSNAILELNNSMTTEKLYSTRRKEVLNNIGFSADGKGNVFVAYENRWLYQVNVEVPTTQSTFSQAPLVQFRFDLTYTVMLFGGNRLVDMST